MVRCCNDRRRHGRLRPCWTWAAEFAWPRRTAMFIIVWVTFMAGVGCAEPSRARIQAEDPNERILAIRAAGLANDAHAVPLLVDRLEDEDEAVRFYAILALERITGQRLGYDYAKPPEVRAEAVERWREYVRRGGHVEPAGGKAAVDPAPLPRGRGDEATAARARQSAFAGEVAQSD